MISESEALELARAFLKTQMEPESNCELAVDETRIYRAGNTMLYDWNSAAYLQTGKLRSLILDGGESVAVDLETGRSWESTPEQVAALYEQEDAALRKQSDDPDPKA
jgi:hypothetical protein